MAETVTTSRPDIDAVADTQVLIDPEYLLLTADGNIYQDASITTLLKAILVQLHAIRQGLEDSIINNNT